MFTAVGLFVILLLVMIYLAFLRFGERPRSTPETAPVGMLTHPVSGPPSRQPVVGRVGAWPYDAEGAAAHA